MARQGPPHLRLETISARNGPCPVCENLRLSLPFPAKTCPGEVGGINCGGDMGVRRCLARSLTSLALLRTPKSANGPRSNSFRLLPPPRPTSHGDGRLRQPPSPHRTWSVPDASSGPQLNLQSIALLTKRHWAVNSNIRIRLKRAAADSLMN